MEAEDQTSSPTRRSEPLEELCFGKFRFEASSGLLHENGVRVPLRPKALEVLRCLLAQPGRLVSKRDLIDEVWDDVVVEDHALTETIRILRQTLGDDPQRPSYIETVHGRGYRFVAPVSVDDEASIAASSLGLGRRFFRWEPRVAASLVATVVALGAVSGIAYRQLSESPGREGALESSAPALPFEEREWVLIADFDNTTGEPIFDSTLEVALKEELTGAGRITMVSRQRIEDTLRLMRRPLDATLDAATALEICLRDGQIRVLVRGGVEKLGPSYVLRVELVDPASGVTVAGLSEEAAGQSEVLPAARRLASWARETLHEELSKFSVIPESERLAKVTTSSLRALGLFMEAGGESGQAQRESRGGPRWLPDLYKEAIAEDPEFASAYIWYAWALRNTRTVPARAAPQDHIPYAERAFELADTTSELEKHWIRGSYHETVGEFDEAVAAYEVLLRLDPRSSLRGEQFAAHFHPGDTTVRKDRARPK